MAANFILKQFYFECIVSWGWSVHAKLQLGRLFFKLVDSTCRLQALQETSGSSLHDYNGCAQHNSRFVIPEVASFATALQTVSISMIHKITNWVWADCHACARLHVDSPSWCTCTAMRVVTSLSTSWQFALLRSVNGFLTHIIPRRYEI